MVPHFNLLQVNHTKRELHNVFIRELYRYHPTKEQLEINHFIHFENLTIFFLSFDIYDLSILWLELNMWPFFFFFFLSKRDDLIEEMLREPEELATKRKRTRETLRVLQQAFRVSAYAYMWWNCAYPFDLCCVIPITKYRLSMRLCYVNK